LRSAHLWVSCFILVIVVLLAGCAPAEHDREEGRQAAATRTLAPDGSIHLTAEQVKLAGVQTTPVEERTVTATVTAIGRVHARLGGESQVFSPFPGQVIADPAKLPRIGRIVRKGQLLAGVEQILTAAVAAQFSVSRIQLQTAIDQAEREVSLTRTEFERSRALYEGGPFRSSNCRWRNSTSSRPQRGLKVPKRKKRSTKPCWRNPLSLAASP